MRTLADIPGIILAGGLGTRLKRVVGDRPKPLAAVGGRPFVCYLLDSLASAGLREVILCSGHLGEVLRATLGERHGDMRLGYSHETKPLGTGGAVARAFGLIHGDEALVLNGDSYCQADLAGFWAGHQKRRAAGSILAARVEEAGRFGRLRLGEDEAVLGFEEKGQGGPGWINAGVYLLHRQIFTGVAGDASVSLEKEIFPRWAGRGLWGQRSGGRFIDIGTPASYAQAEAFFQSLGIKQQEAA